MNVFGNYEVSGDRMAQPGICLLYTVFLPPQEEGKEGNRMANCLRGSIQRLNTQLSRSLQSAFVGSECSKENQESSGPRISDCVHQSPLDGTRVLGNSSGRSGKEG